MIDIRVKNSGIILDMAPDASFQIEFDNPMFEDERCPIQFSTEIAFLPTQKNKQQLGYLDAMFLTPTVKKLDVEFYASGIKLLDGMLTFSSIKDGSLYYTFSGRSVEDDWSGKIYEKEIYQMSGDEDEQDGQFASILNGDVPGIFAPILINAQETDVEATYSADYFWTGVDIVAVGIKYHNYPFKPYRTIPGVYYRYKVLTPAFLLIKVLENELADVDISDIALSFNLANLAILGQYKTDFGVSPSGIPSTGLDLARTLPDITALELFRVVMKMYCCALFRDGDRFSLLNLGKVLEDTSLPLDWDDKVSRNAEISTMPAGGYSFSFANGSDETYNTNEVPVTVDSFDEMLDQIVPDAEMYQVFKHSINDGIISARKVRGGGYSPDLLLCDILCANRDSFDFQPSDSDGDMFDSTVEAKLPRCIPIRLCPGPQSSGLNDSFWRMSAVINPESVGDDRGTDVLIGMVKGGAFEQQFTDGCLYFEDEREVHAAQDAFSLRPAGLFNAWHSAFAQWCRREHQIISADLSLTMSDIAAFRMWHKVSFSGRTWLVKKLTVTFYASNGRADASGEFVTVD